MPSLSDSNRFSILPVYNVTGIDESAETVQAIQPPEDPPAKRKFRPHWERRLPAQLVIASLDESNESPSRSLRLKVNIETSDTGEVKSVDALVDSGATGTMLKLTGSPLGHCQTPYQYAMLMAPLTERQAISPKQSTLF